MGVLIDKKGNIVATHSIKISGHYDPERWDRDKVKEFIDKIDVDESNFEKGMYLVVGHYKNKNKKENYPC